ncbi:hypothetical protein ACWGLC_16215 [Dietzia sp. NPDC055877]
MTDFFLRVDRPENRHTWRFLDSDADGADTMQTISIPHREWLSTATFDKVNEFAEKNPNALPGELIEHIISIEDPEAHKWIKANRKKMPLGALKVMWDEFNSEREMSQGESAASSNS